MSQLTGDLMLVKPTVIDLGWGKLKTALIGLPDSGFATPQSAATQRQTLVNQYVAAFRDVEAAAHDKARGMLKDLSANISAWVVNDKQAALKALVEGQVSKLS